MKSVKLSNDWPDELNIATFDKSGLSLLHELKRKFQTADLSTFIGGLILSFFERIDESSCLKFPF